MPNRYRLKAASLEEMRRKVELRHGPGARIVSAERVISPGIAGLFAADRYEAIVEVIPGNDAIRGEVIPPADLVVEAAAGADGHEASNEREDGKLPAPSGTPADLTVVASLAAPSSERQGAAIAALLAEADAAELSMHPGTRRPDVSTESPNFSEILDKLSAGLHVPAPAVPVPATRETPPATRAAPEAAGAAPPEAASEAALEAPTQARLPPPAPTPLSGIGDLVVLVGLDDGALDIALAMSTSAGGADVRTAGQLSAYGHLHVEGRKDATAARAHAVVTERTVLVAFGLGRGQDAVGKIPAVAALSPDQVWIVVDARRKHEDTARWVEVLADRLNVCGIAVIGAAETSSPESPGRLGLPVGWVDTQPAGSVQL